MTTATLPVLTKKDFQTDQEVRWCPGCGDYAILSAVQSVFPELGIKKENFVIVSGIGCSSRFPYYMNTYGFHPYFQVGANGLEAGRHCRCAAVNRVEAVRVHVIRKTAGTTDAGDDDKILLLDPEFRENGL